MAIFRPGEFPATIRPMQPIKRSAVFVLALALAGALLVQAVQAQAQPQEMSQRSKIIAALNKLRSQGCDGLPGASPELEESPRASRAARQLADGNPLPEALRQAGYRARQALTLHVRGMDLAQPLQAQFPAGACAELLKPGFKEVGLHQSGRDLWLVVALPFTAPAVEDAAQVAQQVLALVNQARAASRRCGNRLWRPAPPVKAQALLTVAAQQHARDMARNNYFAHEAPDGSQVSQRATRAGYAWRKVGENIAAGQGSAQEVVAGWLQSPRHCDNLMDPVYTDMGLAYALAREGDQGIYWVQVFGAPR